MLECFDKGSADSSDGEDVVSLIRLVLPGYWAWDGYKGNAS